MPLTTLNRLILIANSPALYGPLALKTRPAALVGYWPLSEMLGPVAYDRGPRALNGAYAAQVQTAPGIGDNLTAVNFRSGFYMTCPAALPYINANEGTFSCWARASSSAIWTDGLTHSVFWIGGTSSKRITLYKYSLNPNSLTLEYYSTGQKYVGGSVSFPAWMHLAGSWSVSANSGAGELKFFVNGVQAGATVTSLVAWSDTPTSFYISTTSGQWSGPIAHAALWSVPLTPAEILSLSKYTP